jgi:hypothetical protein
VKSAANELCRKVRSCGAGLGGSGLDGGLTRALFVRAGQCLAEGIPSLRWTPSCTGHPPQLRWGGRCSRSSTPLPPHLNSSHGRAAGPHR